MDWAGEWRDTKRKLKVAGLLLGLYAAVYLGALALHFGGLDCR